VAALLCCCAASFSGKLLVMPSWTHTDATGPATVSETFSRLLEWDHTSGTTSNQMDQLFRERVTLTNSAERVIDIAGGVTNAFGSVITFAEVRFFAVISPSSNLNAITVGAADTNAFSTWCGDTNHTATIRPGGIMLLVAPDATAYAVSTNGNIKVLNAGTNSVTYDLYVGGASS
jgi:hypothetical protein